MALRGLILRNFWLKLFSVALATVIWLSIHFGVGNHLLAHEYIRVHVATVGDGHSVRLTPEEVVVVVVGEEKALRKAEMKNISAYVDLTEFHARHAGLVEVHTEVPPDINVLEVSPAVVTVERIPH